MQIHKSITFALILSMIAPAGVFAREPAASREKLAPGYLLKVGSTRDTNLNGEFRIDIDGKVTLPYDITLDAAGKNLREFDQLISRSYQPYFTGAPNISISIKSRAYWIDVRGMVKRPGAYLVKPDASLDEVLAQAGGLSEATTSGFARIKQGSKVSWVDLNAYFKQGDQSAVPKWVGADRIFFQKERPTGTDQERAQALTGRIQVLGEVRTPGEQTFEENADGYHYLMRSGGPTTQSDLGEVEVIRTKPDGSHEQISLGPIAKVHDLQDSDMLIIHPTRPTGFERFLQNSALAASILSAALLGYLATRTNK